MEVSKKTCMKDLKNWRVFYEGYKDDLENKTVKTHFNLYLWGF